MITAHDLWFSYDGGEPYVLRGVELHIPRGEYVSVVGDNGSGKSTLMRLALGLLKPARGTIECAADVTGYVPQRRAEQNAAFPLTVAEMLRSYARLRHIDKSRRSADTEASRVLELVGLSDKRGALVGELSGGQSQKMLIARALIGSPELLVFDEPSTGIDRASAEEIYALMRRLNRDDGVTIVSVEHNLAAAMANSTHIYHLSGGHGHICTPEQYAREFLGDSDVTA
ncbi:MAG: metal ABC transporter ATP-binding protein [Oscillospiraceae bacterium]|jgi:zinc transport system ATP-binding protein|nr:metal ABC transporter ATP-binding protein [Oscillospiraceae bacterium]